jgi:hypothetical protein
MKTNLQKHTQFLRFPSLLFADTQLLSAEIMSFLPTMDFDLNIIAFYRNILTSFPRLPQCR